MITRRSLLAGALPLLTVPKIASARGRAAVRATGSIPVGPGPIMRSFDFYSKFGVTGLDPVDVPNTTSLVNTIGISNIRSGASGVDAAGANADMSAAAGYASNGIRQHIEVIAFSGIQFGSLSDWLSALKTYIVGPYGPQMVTGLSGPNEVNIQYFGYQGQTGIAAANMVQRDLYLAVKADPMLSSILVDMWPVAFPQNATTPVAVGNMNAYCDRTNLHDYYGSDFSGFSPSPMPAFRAAVLTNMQGISNKPHFITTESGWNTPNCGCTDGLNCDEPTQACLVLDMLFDHASLISCDHVYYFSLVGGGPTGSSGSYWYGLYNDSWVLKQSGTALQRTIAILKDTGGTAATFTSAPFSYSLSGMPAQGFSHVVAKSNGAYDILLWNEPRIWDQVAFAQVAVTSTSVTINLPRLMSGNVYDPINSATAIATFSSQNSVTVSLNKYPLVIEVT